MPDFERQLHEARQWAERAREALDPKQRAIFQDLSDRYHRLAEALRRQGRTPRVD